MAKLDKQQARRLLKFLYERVATLDNPRSIGEAFKGSRLSDYWKYRVSDYRIISHVEDEILRGIVVKIGHRREIYKQTPCPHKNEQQANKTKPP